MANCKRSIDRKTLKISINLGAATVLAVAALLAGCSSTTPVANERVTNPATNSAPPTNPAAANVNSAPVNTVEPAVPGNMADKLRKNKEAGPGPVAGPPPPLPYQPAGEDSEVATTMNREGQPLQIRVFKSHKLLAKVESTWLDANNKQLKIQLRSGRVITITTDKIGDLRQASTSTILEIAGIQSNANAPAESR